MPNYTGFQPAGHAAEQQALGAQRHREAQERGRREEQRKMKYGWGGGTERAYGEYTIGTADDRPWQQRMDQQVGFAGDTLERMESGQLSQAQRQMQAGLGAAQQQSMAQAVGRGSNPLAQRAAAYGSAQAGQQAVTQSAMLRAAEEQAARQQYADVLKQQSMGTMGFTQMDLQRRMAQAQHHAQMMGLQEQADQNDFNNTMQIAGAVMQGAGAMAVSDERVKEMKQRLAAAEADAAMAKMSQSDPYAGMRLQMPDPGPSQWPTAQDTDYRTSMDQTYGYLAALPDGKYAQSGMREDIYEPPEGMQPFREVTRDKADQQMQSRFSGALMGAGGRLMSDERAKQAAYLAGRRDQDEAMFAVQRAALGAARQTPEYTAWRGGSEPVPRRPAPALPPYGTWGTPRRVAGRGLAAVASRAGQGAEARAQMMDRTLAQAPDLHTYEYKPGVAEAMDLPTGRRAGIMAQELERSGPVGRGMVVDTPQGKQIDVGAMASTNMALTGRLAERVEELERKRGKGAKK